MEEQNTVSEPTKASEPKSVKNYSGIFKIAVVAIVFLAIGILAGGFIMPQTGMAVLPAGNGNNGGNAIAGQDAVSQKTMEYLNENFFASQGLTAKLSGVSEEYGMYNVAFDVLQGTETQGAMSVFVSLDGKTMVVAQQVFDLDTPVPQAEPEQPVEVQKSDSPKVELFVMSFCPYGIVAEQAMSPVFALLKDNADISVHFIASVTGDTPESVQSLHGANEAMEDLRQVCVVKEYGTEAFWKYVDYINATCPTAYSDAAALDACWKKAAEEAGIDAAKIDSCSKSSEALDLLRADEALTGQYGVSGSPTLIINGAQVSPARTPEGFKQAICDAFNTAPETCVQQLSGDAAAASGSCG